MSTCSHLSVANNFMLPASILHYRRTVFLCMNQGMPFNMHWKWSALYAWVNTKLNIQGAKHCSSLQQLQDFIGVNLPTSICTPDFSVVEMGYIEAGHGAKGRRSGCLMMMTSSKCTSATRRKRIYYSCVIPKKRGRKQCRKKLAQTKIKCQGEHPITSHS